MSLTTVADCNMEFFLFLSLLPLTMETFNCIIFAINSIYMCVIFGMYVTICVMSGIMTHSAIGAIEVERDLVVTVNLKQTMSLCQIYKCVYMYTYIYDICINVYVCVYVYTYCAHAQCTQYTYIYMYTYVLRFSFV